MDTNALARFLVRDDEEQAQAVRKELLKAAKKGEALFVPLAVTLEIIWVLSSVYGYSKNEIIQALDGLLKLSVLQMDGHESISDLCIWATSEKTELSDLFIGVSAREYGCETTLTFDKKAARSDLFTLLQ